MPIWIVHHWKIGKIYLHLLLVILPAVVSHCHVVQSGSSNHTCVGASQAQYLPPNGKSLHSHFQPLPEKIHISVKSQSVTFASTRINKYVNFQSCLGMKKEILSETSVVLKTEAASSSEALSKHYTVSQCKIRLLPNILLH